MAYVDKLSRLNESKNRDAEIHEILGRKSFCHLLPPESEASLGLVRGGGAALDPTPCDGLAAVETQTVNFTLAIIWSNMEGVNVREDSFPSRSREASGLVNGVATEVTSTSFSDRILLTISQEGRLSQWIQVPLTGSSAGVVEMTLPSMNKGLLPSTHLTPTTLLGGGGEERETLGQLYAAQLASHLSLRSPDDRRILVVGLGLAKTDLEREAFFDLLELAQKVL